jgi:hypothetical protein
MIFLPKSISIEQIHEVGKQKIEKYYPQRMEKIITLIQRSNFASLKKGNEKPKKEKPYVHSADLKRISGNYKDYIGVLFEFDVLKIDEDYSHKGIRPESPCFPKSYYFTPIYREKLIYRNTVYCSMDNNEKNDSITPYSTINLDDTLQFQLNRFFAFLEFDSNYILDYLDKEFSGSIKGGTTGKNGKQLKKAFLKYNSAIYLTNSLASRNYHFFRNHTNHRLYGPLTNYPKRLRKHFTMKGKKMVSIDLSNAQPFLSLLLFDKRFWQGEDCSDQLPLNIDTIGMKNYFKGSIYNYLDENHLSSVEKFKGLVLNDSLYNQLIEDEVLSENEYQKKKKKAKESMYTIMFSKAKSSYKTRPKSNRAKFKANFPDIYDFWAQIKDSQNQNLPIILNPESETEQESHSLLAIILQRMEAFLFLDVIVPYILKNHPGVPIIPIHDCLATTVEHKDLVTSIVKKTNI